MKTTQAKCDIEDLEHTGLVGEFDTFVMFDHDQEDGKSKRTPYFERKTLDLCESCWKHMIENRRIIYAYGAMGYNKYYLK